MKKRNQGFAALAMVIILSSLLLLVFVTSSFSLFTFSTIRQQQMAKDASRVLAESCLDYALMRSVADPEYIVAEPRLLSTQSGQCLIESVTVNGSLRIIATSARVDKSATVLNATLDIAEAGKPTVVSFRDTSS